MADTSQLELYHNLPLIHRNELPYLLIERLVFRSFCRFCLKVSVRLLMRDIHCTSFGKLSLSLIKRQNSRLSIFKMNPIGINFLLFQRQKFCSESLKIAHTQLRKK